MSTDSPQTSPNTPSAPEFVYRNMTIDEFDQWLRERKTAFRNGRWLNWPETENPGDIAIHNSDWNKDKPFRFSGDFLDRYKLRDLIDEQGILTGTEEQPDGEVLSDTRDEQDPANTTDDAGGVAEK